MKVQGYNDKVMMSKLVLANMPDKDLRTLAYMAAHENKSKLSPMDKALISLPVVSGAASAILTKGSLATRMGTGLLKGAGWAVPLAAFGVFNKTENVALNNSSKLRNFKEKNPLAYSLANIALFLSALSLGSKGLNKGVAKLGEKINLVKASKLVEGAAVKSGVTTTLANLFIKAEGLFKSAAKSIDKSIFNTKMMPKLASASAWLGEKAPIVKSSAKSVLKAASWIMIGGGMLKSMNESSQVAKGANNNYFMLKEAQLEARKDLQAQKTVEEHEFHDCAAGDCANELDD